MSGEFLRGAFVQLATTLLVPIPNIIIFQFNPETMRHTVTPATSGGGASSGAAAGNAPAANPLAVAGTPGESFGFSLQMNSDEDIAADTPVTAQLAQVSGVYSRLAALEMLVFPEDTGSGLVGTVSSALGASGSSAETAAVPRSQVPPLLFVWGPGRIVPVRITSLTITEKLFDALLNPTFAEAQVELKMLTQEEIGGLTGVAKDVASAAYEYTKVFRKTLATANLANTASSIVGMLPL